MTKMTHEQMLESIPYMKLYEGIDFRYHKELYRVGLGEQGALIVEPYKSEIASYWRFSTPAVAQKSANKIFVMFLEYMRLDDFPGADMARKFLQMGWSRSRRYANHPSGRKYKSGTREILPLADDCYTSQKVKSAEIFKEVYDRARTNSLYLKMKREHQLRYPFKG